MIFAQARIVFGPTATFMRMNGGTAATPIYLVVGNSAANAISHTAGGIISESEFNYVKWNIGTTTGVSYRVPFRDNTTPATEDVAIQFDVAIAGAPASGFFLLSTYDGGSWDNDVFRPTAVTHVGDSMGNNNSQYVIDRFWGVVSEGSYASKPAINNLTFNYLDNEYAGAGNTITEANLRAQRWNSTVSSWHGWITGTVNTGANTVTIASLANTDLFRWWTLTDATSPLPVEFLSLHAECKQTSGGNNQVEVTWATATESNTDYFQVERGSSVDNFSVIKIIPAAGNSSSIKNYSYSDTELINQVTFYRITEVSLNGSSQSTEAVSVKPCLGDNENILVYGNNGNLSILINSSENDQYKIRVTNSIGQEILREERILSLGQHTINLTPENISDGVYVVTVSNKQHIVSRKVFLTKTH